MNPEFVALIVSLAGCVTYIAKRLLDAFVSKQAGPADRLGGKGKDTIIFEAKRAADHDEAMAILRRLDEGIGSIEKRVRRIETMVNDETKVG